MGPNAFGPPRPPRWTAFDLVDELGMSLAAARYALAEWMRAGRVRQLDERDGITGAALYDATEVRAAYDEDRAAREPGELPPP